MTTTSSRTEQVAGTLGSALQRFVSTYWLKKRVVLAQFSGNVAARPAADTGAMAVQIYSGRTPSDRLAPGLLDALTHTIGSERLFARLARPDVTLVLGVDRETGQPTGFRWAIHPSDRTVWHDNIPVEPGEAFGFNAFTYPRYRRKGLYRELVRVGNAFLFEELGREKMTIVIEASNEASLNANLGAGYAIVGRNYLLKVQRRNFYSVFREDATGRTRAYLVFRNERGVRL